MPILCICVIECNNRRRETKLNRKMLSLYINVRFILLHYTVIKDILWPKYNPLSNCCTKLESHPPQPSTPKHNVDSLVLSFWLHLSGYIGLLTRELEQRECERWQTWILRIVGNICFVACSHPRTIICASSFK